MIVLSYLFALIKDLRYGFQKRIGSDIRSTVKHKSISPFWFMQVFSRKYFLIYLVKLRMEKEQDL